MQEVQVEELVTDEDMTLLSWPFRDNPVTNRNHMQMWGGEMAWWVKCLLYKHGGLSSDPQHHVKARHRARVCSLLTKSRTRWTNLWTQIFG